MAVSLKTKPEPKPKGRPKGSPNKSKKSDTNSPPVLYQEGGSSFSGGGVLVVPPPVNVQQAITTIETKQKPRDPADERQKNKPNAKQIPRRTAK